MKSEKRLKTLIGFHVSVLFILLLCVIATPLVIRHSISITSRFIIEEEYFESILIILLFAFSYLILRGFKRTLDAYAQAAARAGEDKSRLVSQLAEAFSYIGTVNVEIQEIQSIYCGVACYPQTQKELKQLLNRLATKAMAIAGTPWIIIRMISRYSGRTVKEVAIERRRGVLPSSAVGNRAILEGCHVDGLTTICSRRENIDLLTVCVLPETTMGKDETVLITAITNQIEMLFMLFRSGVLHQQMITKESKKEICHDIHS